MMQCHCELCDLGGMETSSVAVFTFSHSSEGTWRLRSLARKTGSSVLAGTTTQGVTVSPPLRGDDLWAELHFPPRSFEPSMLAALTISWAFLD